MSVVGKLPVNGLGCLAVCLVTLLCGVEQAKVDKAGRFASDMSLELLGIFIKINTFVTGGVIFPLAFMAHVLTRRSWTQVVPLVVRSVLVFVIDLKFWPFSSHNQPREPMSLPFIPSQTNPMIPFRWRDTGFLAAEVVPICQLPPKNTRLRIVAENRPHILRRQVVARILVAWFGLVSHSISFLGSKWSGPGEGVGIASPFPLYALLRNGGQA